MVNLGKELTKMDFQAEFQRYGDEKKKLNNLIINYIEDSDNCETNFSQLIEFINLNKYQENQEELSHLLRLIVNIADNHYRNERFMMKIEQILQNLKDQIKQSFSNLEIYNLFQSNKTILLYLIKNDIIVIDEEIFYLITSKIKGTQFCHFFYPEIKKANFESEKVDEIEKEINSVDSNIFENFEDKRIEGVNESYICSLIRQDSVIEFVSHVNRQNISLESKINHSIFETNLFLIENQATLIEYAAFYGSIEIFQYLRLNNVELSSSLWLYAIHSKNAELIHILEENNVDLPNKSYDQCLIESIKCHHNDIANYFRSNFDIKDNEEILSSVYQFHNYFYFPNELKHDFDFFYLCAYNYSSLVNFRMKLKEQEIKLDMNDILIIVLVLFSIIKNCS